MAWIPADGDPVPAFSRNIGFQSVGIQSLRKHNTLTMAWVPAGGDPVPAFCRNIGFQPAGTWPVRRKEVYLGTTIKTQVSNISGYSGKHAIILPFQSC